MVIQRTSLNYSKTGDSVELLEYQQRSLLSYDVLAGSPTGDGLSQALQQAFQLGLTVFEPPDPVGQLLDVGPQVLLNRHQVGSRPLLCLHHVSPQLGKQTGR